ncbi:MAG TPA: hypothetical protein VGF10_06755 [Gaiella sp.]|jgi:hypothetical protein
MRARLVAGVAIAWLAAASPAIAADRTVDRGIVQSVTPTVLVLRSLDGVEVEVPLGPATRFRLNGLPATLADVQPGFVAETVRFGTRAAVRVRAFGRVATTTERGRLLAVQDGSLVLRASAGRTRIPISSRTVVRRRGRLVALRVLRVGMRVEVVRAVDGSAQTVRVLRAGA